MKTYIFTKLFILLSCAVIAFSSCSSPAVDLPEYKVLDVVDQMVGGKYADILVPSFSRETPLVELKLFAKELAKIKGFDEMSIYCTEEAYKANFSASFSEEHPGALEEGYLGMYRDGTFHPPW